MDKLPIWKFAFDLIQTAFVTGITIYVWILGKHKASMSKISELEERHGQQLNDVQNRLSIIETRLGHMPNRESIGNIHKRLDEQARILHSLEGQLKGMADSNNLILDVLLKRGDKS